MMNHCRGISCRGGGYFLDQAGMRVLVLEKENLPL
jgi:hypothetical protein